MDRYPGDRHGHDAALAFYSEEGFRMESIASFPPNCLRIQLMMWRCCPSWAIIAEFARNALMVL